MHILRIRRGMTLVEVLAVVVILGLLAATLVGGLAGKLSTARHEIARTQIGQIVSHLESYQLAHQRLPTTGEGLAALTRDHTAAFYLEAGKLIDPWGRTYQFLVPGPDNRPFEILTLGADGQRGGTGDNADLSSAALRQ